MYDKIPRGKLFRFFHLFEDKVDQFNHRNGFVLNLYHDDPFHTLMYQS